MDLLYFRFLCRIDLAKIFQSNLIYYCHFPETSTISHHDVATEIVTSSNQTTGITYPVVVAIGTVSVIFGVFIGIVGNQLANLLIKKKQKCCNKRNQLQSPEVPVHEDVTTELKIQVSPNVAYQEVHKQL